VARRGVGGRWVVAVLHKLVMHPPTVQQTARYCLSIRSRGDTVYVRTMTHFTSL
jgi:hypothetical protein